MVLKISRPRRENNPAEGADPRSAVPAAAARRASILK
jgi:hypothetical protein